MEHQQEDNYSQYVCQILQISRGKPRLEQVKRRVGRTLDLQGGEQTILNCPGARQFRSNRRCTATELSNAHILLEIQWHARRAEYVK